MKTEKKKGKQSVSVVASLFVTFFIASSVVFLDEDYTFGLEIPPQVVNLEEEKRFTLINKMEFVFGPEAEEPDVVYHYEDTVDLVLERRHVEPLAHGAGGDLPTEPGDLNYENVIRADVLIDAEKGIELGGEVLLTVPQFHSDGVAALYATHGSGLGAVVNKGISNGTVSGGGPTLYYPPVKYDPTPSGQEPRERTVLFAAKDKEVNISVVADKGHFGGSDFVLMTDGSEQSIKKTLDELSEAVSTLNEKNRVIASENSQLREEVKYNKYQIESIMSENSKLKEAFALLVERLRNIEDKLYSGKGG